MSSQASIQPNLAQLEPKPITSGWQAWCRRQAISHLDGLTRGVIRLRDANGTSIHGQGDASQAPTLHVIDPSTYTSIVRGGTVGFAEAYFRHAWDTDDLTSLLRVFARDSETTKNARKGLASVARVIRSIGYRLRRNTPRGSRRNIHDHYDLGNDLFEMFLDDTLMYSCAVFDHPGQTLHDASLNKLDRICQKLNLQPGDRVVEIGTGWGGFAIHAAKHYGCHVTTTTISREQHRVAAERVEAAGLQDRVTLLLDDYRDLEGTYDKLVSIEMIEAVGHEHLPIFMRLCNDLLKPDGEMLLQVINMPDAYYDDYRKNVDFIQRYVFPGSCCPSPGAIAQAVAKAGHLKLIGIEDITAHYARTLAEWRHNFQSGLDRLSPQKYPHRFRRLWHYYLCYCEAGFAERYIATSQMHYRKVVPGVGIATASGIE